MTLALVHVCACILLLLNTITKEELHYCLHNTTSKELFYNYNYSMFIFTCGVALIGGHVQLLTNRKHGNGR